MDFKQCKVLADIKYCEATNVEYEQYYKDNYDNNFELIEPDTEYDGYIVILYDRQPEWFSKELFKQEIELNLRTE